MKWPSKKFSELYLVPSRNGLNRPASVRGEGYKMVNMCELFANGRIGDIPMERVPMNDKELERGTLVKGDLLFARQSLVLEGAGKCSFVAQVPEPTTFESHLIRVRLDTAKCSPLFYYYLFASPFSGVPTIVQQCAQAGIRASELAQLEVLYPPTTTQERISDILSSYDDLIENNQRRMALLEEAARQVYREWFVRMRFPGYQHTRIVDGVPEGWEKTNALQAISIHGGGTPKTSMPDYWDGDIPFYTPKDATESCYVLETERSITPLGLRNCNSMLYAADTVFISARGTVGKSNLALRPMAMSQSCYAVVGRLHVSQLFLYCALRESAGHLKQHAVGAVFDAIVVDTFKRIPFMLPDETTVNLFEGSVTPLFRQIGILLRQNVKLRAVRELLLPRLMSGEIAV